MKFDTHYTLYENFKKDADKEDNFIGTRVEAYFLAAFHLIESCAAKERVHINKHQKVKICLEENHFIFGDKTGIIWETFQHIENQLRPKFTYGDSGEEKDFMQIKDDFHTIEKLCGVGQDG